MSERAPTSEGSPESVPVGCGWPGALAVIAIAGLVALLLFYLLHGALETPGRMANAVGEAAGKFAKFFGTTEVKVDNTSVTLELRRILELATVQHRVVCVSKYTTTWAGSTATIIIRGVYTVKAGFELEKGTTFRLDEKGEVIDATVPPAKLLSVTTVEQKVYFDAQGVLKTLEGRDYEEAFRQNRAQADREATQMGLLEEARTRLKERLHDMLPGPAGPPLLPQLAPRKD